MSRLETTAPRFIVVEGPIGVGKTSLAKRLAETFGYATLFEAPEDNPFLARFYEEERRHALPTQLFFLLQRAEQLRALRQEDLFGAGRIADFLINKDQLFAELNLDPDELDLYRQVYDHLTIAAPVPDLVVYLQAPPPVLARRIQRRGIAAEQHIDRSYLERLVETYAQFFHYYDAGPLLIVNAAEIDLVDDQSQYDRLVDVIRRPDGSRSYFNPHPTLI